MTGPAEFPNVGGLAWRAVTELHATLEARAERRLLTGWERSELARCETAERELQALHRARVWRDATPDCTCLHIVQAQVNELRDAGLGLDCLNPDDLRAIHEAWPSWKPGDAPSLGQPRANAVQLSG